MTFVLHKSIDNAEVVCGCRFSMISDGSVVTHGVMQISWDFPNCTCFLYDISVYFTSIMSGLCPEQLTFVISKVLLYVTLNCLWGHYCVTDLLLCVFINFIDFFVRKYTVKLTIQCWWSSKLDTDFSNFAPQNQFCTISTRCVQFFNEFGYSIFLPPLIPRNIMFWVVRLSVHVYVHMHMHAETCIKINKMCINVK